MRRLLTAISICLLSAVLLAQTPVIIGPTTLLQWDMPGAAAALANVCQYKVSTTQTGTYTPLIGSVTCSDPTPAPTPPQATCSVNLLSQTMIPIGSGTLFMTATCSGVTSVPSTAFAYMDVLIPVPANLRVK